MHSCTSATFLPHLHVGQCLPRLRVEHLLEALESAMEEADQDEQPQERQGEQIDVGELESEQDESQRRLEHRSEQEQLELEQRRGPKKATREAWSHGRSRRLARLCQSPRLVACSSCASPGPSPSRTASASSA